VYMRRSLKAILASVLAVAGFAGVVAFMVFLTGQGLDRAEKWVSIVGATLSLALALAGFRLGWLTWRHTGASTAVPPSVDAEGAGAVAIGGESTGEIVTDISGAVPTPGPLSTSAAGVNARGSGSVAVGGASGAPIRTKVTGPDGRSTP
jgi:hypothetical protein